MSSKLLHLFPAGLAIALALAVSSALLAPGRAAAADPTIALVSPNSGSTAGGTAITITGTNFQTGASVYVGSNQATGVVVVSPTQITAVTAAGTAGPAYVLVINPDSTSVYSAAAYTYTTTPTTTAITVTGVAPATGPSSGGTVITISGTGFQANASVLIGFLNATNVTVVSSTQITATTPPNTTATAPLSVTVANPDGTSGSLSSGFTYGTSSGVLSISGVSPGSGSINGGTPVTISGSGLAAVTSVQFGGVAGTTLVVTSDASLTVRTPAHSAGTVAVTVVNSSGSSTTLPNAFVFNTTATVTVTAVAPSSGSVLGGTSVVLTGSGFATGMTVSVGGTAATNVAVTSSTQATATTPAHTAGTADIVVTLATGETATLASGFTYQTGPAAGAISPPLPAAGFGLFVFSGGTSQQLFTASNCSQSTAAFWATDATGNFVVYVPGTTISAVNAAWNAAFPSGIPANTALIGKCA